MGKGKRDLLDIDGIEVTRRLKAQEETADIPIYVLSSYAMERDKQRALDAGCLVYLTKPLSPAKLLEHVDAFFRVKSNQEAD